MWASIENLNDTYNPRADEAIAAASHILWSLTGRRYSGTRSVVEMYDVRHGLGWIDRYHYFQQQALFQIERRDLFLCTECGYPHRMRLRHQPVQRILSVEINGEVVAPGDYVLLNHSTLGLPFTRLACNALCARVSYVWGVNPPAGGRMAAARLADQLLLAWDNSDDCKLPQRVTNVTRQGVSWTILDPQTFLDDGKTGIYEIDLFLKSINPDKARRPARVFSPDLARASTVVQETIPPMVSITASDLALVSSGDPAWYVAPGSVWPGWEFTPFARINGVVYDSTHFTTNSDGSVTFLLSPGETYALSAGDPFQLLAHSTLGGDDEVVVDGHVRLIS